MSANLEQPFERLSPYLRDVQRIPLLSTAEQLALARAARRGNTHAKRRLVEANLRLVISLARRYAGFGLALEDLIQEGNLGLIHAVDKFDPARGCKFSTYAFPWIQKTISEAIARRGRHVTLTPSIEASLRQIGHIEEHLTGELRRQPTDEEVAAELSMTPEELGILRSLKQTPISLHMPNSDEDEAALQDRIPDVNGVEPDDLVHVRLLREAVARALSLLTERERRVLELRYGLKDGAERSYRNIAAQIGISREAVRKLDLSMLERLRHNAELRCWRQSARLTD